MGTYLNLLRASTIGRTISIMISIRSTATAMAKLCYCVSTPWVVVHRQVTLLAGSLEQWANRIAPRLRRVLRMVLSITETRELFQSFGILLTWQRRERSSLWPVRT